jgi:hypothetical protein
VMPQHMADDIPRHCNRPAWLVEVEFERVSMQAVVTQLRQCAFSSDHHLSLSAAAGRIRSKELYSTSTCLL